MDGREIVGIADHELQHILAIDHRILGGIGLFEAVQGDDGTPALVGGFLGLRHQRHLVGHVEQAGEILGALHVTRHPEQMIGSTTQHD
jgi:hypothetical protein